MKQQIRSHYQNIRQQLSLENVSLKSEQIARQLFSTSIWQQSQTIMLYLSFQNEVATDRIFQQGWREKKTMVIPICAPENHTMTMSRLEDFAALQYNCYGIQELPPQLQQTVSPEVIDLCLIPGIAFDYKGNRIGFGAGYYDRYLSLTRPDAIRLALAFECQISSTPLPIEAFDLPMHYILTERQLYHIL